MKIEVFQSGGYAGERIKLKELSDKNIGSIDIGKIKEFLTKTDFFNLQKDTPSEKSIGADMLDYELWVEDGEKSNRVKFRKSKSTQNLNDLLEFILSK